MQKTSMTGDGPALRVNGTGSKKALKSACAHYFYLNSDTELIVLQKQMESRKDSEMTAVYIYGRYWCLVRVCVCVRALIVNLYLITSHLLMICWG